MSSILLILATVGMLFIPEHHTYRMPVEGSMGCIEHVWEFDENIILHTCEKDEYYVFADTNIRLDEQEDSIRVLYGESDQAPSAWLNAGL